MMKIKNYYLLVALLLPSFASYAETVYVDDNQDLVWIRTGPSKEYRVLPPIAPGTVLQTLQVDQETGFTQVKDVAGREFWIETQYLSKTPTAKHRLADALKKINSMQQSHAEQVTTLQKRIADLEPLETANADLQAKLAQLETDQEQARQKVEMLESGFKSEFFFAGSVVVLAGMFFGWLLTKLGGRNRNSSWS